MERGKLGRAVPARPDNVNAGVVEGAAWAALPTAAAELASIVAAMTELAVTTNATFRLVFMTVTKEHWNLRT